MNAKSKYGCLYDKKTNAKLPGKRFGFTRRQNVRWPHLLLRGHVFAGFARALERVADVGTFGANKYTDNGWESVPHGRARYTDALYRHLLAEGRGETNDSESGLEHAAHTAWNALARLELQLRELHK